ncbi:MAG: helix-hairpin-helix domain-containing protein [Bacteroidia bacterium]
MPSNFLNNFFGFNKQQRNGLLMLSLISFTLLLIRIIYPYFIKPDNIVIQNLPLIERKLDSSYENTKIKYANNFSENKTSAKLFVFDPNTVSFDQLIQLGFKEKVATIFLKFRDKGFVFKQKKDLQKVYGISDNFYAQLERYILIENKITDNKKEPTEILKAKDQIKKKVELNAVDSLALINLNGIGPAFAKRILKYRSVLGGYVAIEQLKEVYGFTDELFDKIKTSVTVNATLIKKIDLNNDDFKSINKHPYLSYELTKSIFNLRKKGAVTAENLKDIISDDPLYNKLLPYLQF